MDAKKREVVIASSAPQPIGPYSVGVRWGGLMFTSGAIGTDPESGELVGGGIAAETRQALENLSQVLNAGGSSLDRVVKTTVFLDDLQDYAAMNEVYAEFFSQDPPARSAVEVAQLPKGAAVEIEAIAVLSQGHGD
ncbi:MAG: RidA family protein [Anaerolineales bacterium]|nr:RidA family protein [Anaerolineales bacterium]